MANTGHACNMVKRTWINRLDKQNAVMGLVRECTSLTLTNVLRLGNLTRVFLKVIWLSHVKLANNVRFIMTLFLIMYDHFYCLLMKNIK